MDTTGLLILSTKIESIHTKLASWRLLAGKKKQKNLHMKEEEEKRWIPGFKLLGKKEKAPIIRSCFIPSPKFTELIRCFFSHGES